MLHKSQVQVVDETSLATPDQLARLINRFTMSSQGAEEEPTQGNMYVVQHAHMHVCTLPPHWHARLSHAAMSSNPHPRPPPHINRFNTRLYTLARTTTNGNTVQLMIHGIPQGPPWSLELYLPTGGVDV